MEITILNTSADHPINAWLQDWIKRNQNKHKVSLLRIKKDLVGGDILFLISCSELLSKIDRSKFKKTLLIHASDLPKGRGWSPHIWEILNGAGQIVVSLLEADDEIDSGDIWKKSKVNVPKNALYDEINKKIFDAELELMDFAIENFDIVDAQKQSDTKPTFWPKRTHKDSEIDLKKTIDEQFDVIRVCDPNRFPAFFYKDGKRFILKIETKDE
jgi:methionyl-tRNA formyltransferase